MCKEISGIILLWLSMHLWKDLTSAINEKRNLYLIAPFIIKSKQSCSVCYTLFQSSFRFIVFILVNSLLGLINSSLGYASRMKTQVRKSVSVVGEDREWVCRRRVRTECFSKESARISWDAPLNERRISIGQVCSFRRI